MIQHPLPIKAKFCCIMEKNKESVEIVRGSVDDFYLWCLECVGKVDQDSMIDVCDRVGVKEYLTTVPVELGDISEVENTDPLTETLYL